MTPVRFLRMWRGRKLHKNRAMPSDMLLKVGKIDLTTWEWGGGVHVKEKKLRAISQTLMHQFKETCPHAMVKIRGKQVHLDVALPLGKGDCSDVEYTVPLEDVILSTVWSAQSEDGTPRDGYRLIAARLRAIADALDYVANAPPEEEDLLNKDEEIDSGSMFDSQQQQQETT